MKLLLPLSVAICLPLAACKSSIASRVPVEAAIADFHADYNAGAYTHIREEADPDFKDGNSSADLSSNLTIVKAKLGRFKSSRIVSFNLSTGVDSGTARVTVESIYELGKASEEFRFFIDSGKPFLHSLAIDAPSVGLKKTL